MAVEPHRRYGPTGTAFTPVFTPSSLRMHREVPMHTIRNRPIPKPPGFDPRKPWGYTIQNRAGVQVMLSRGGPAPASPPQLSLADVIRRVVARFGGTVRGPTRLVPTNPNDRGGMRVVPLSSLPR